jgi:hypothetical protein
VLLGALAIAEFRSRIDPVTLMGARRAAKRSVLRLRFPRAPQTGLAFIYILLIPSETKIAAHVH